MCDCEPRSWERGWKVGSCEELLIVFWLREEVMIRLDKVSAGSCMLMLLLAETQPPSPPLKQAAWRPHITEQIGSL